MNTKTKGDVAVGQAISFFLSNGFEVCLPIGDKRHYDLVIEKDGKLERVQVKYAGINNKGKCLVALRVTGGNQSYNYAKKYQDDAFDTLFVYTSKGQKFMIPWSLVTCRNEMTIEDKKYKVYSVS